MHHQAILYLIPSILSEEGFPAIPQYVLTAIRECEVFFVENDRTSRRYIKRLARIHQPEKEFVIDAHEWIVIGKAEEEVQLQFKTHISAGKKIGLLSEAGCPGVADPGQKLVSLAHQMKADVRPLAGPSSMLLALMASGLNGQQFQFVGYLPIESQSRVKAIRELEAESKKKNCTQIFIETPYRNMQLFDALMKACASSTRLCVAADLTGSNEWIRTATINDWKIEHPELHKRPAIFLILG